MNHTLYQHTSAPIYIYIYIYTITCSVNGPKSIRAMLESVRVILLRGHVVAEIQRPKWRLLDLIALVQQRPRTGQSERTGNGSWTISRHVPQRWPVCRSNELLLQKDPGASKLELGSICAPSLQSKDGLVTSSSGRPIGITGPRAGHNIRIITNDGFVGTNPRVEKQSFMDTNGHVRNCVQSATYLGHTCHILYSHRAPVHSMPGKIAEVADGPARLFSRSIYAGQRRLLLTVTQRNSGG
jgi:hypothetical protein